MYRARWLPLLVSLVFVLLANLSIASTDIPRNTATAMVRLPGHTLPILSKATKLGPQTDESNQPITLTIVLKRDDQTGFERYLHETYDPRSENFHHYLTQRQIANRFGPSRRDYNSVLHYLQKDGFRLIQGSKNRLTLTVRATTSRDAENAFAIRIGHTVSASDTSTRTTGTPLCRRS